MVIDSLLNAGIVLTIIICIFNGWQFLFRKEIRNSSHKRYKLTCYILALAYFFLASGNIAVGFLQHWHYTPMPLMGIITSTISSSQSLLFTFALIILYTGKDATLKRLFLYAIPIVLFPLLYFFSTRYQENYDARSLQDLFAHLSTNKPLLVRFLFCTVYILQMGLFTTDFFRERKRYMEQIQRVGVVGPDSYEIRLRWVKIAFLTALAEGIIATLIQVFPCYFTESIFRLATIIFYSLFPIFYIKYGDLYERLRALESESQLSNEEPQEEEAGMDAIIARLIERNNLLFQKVEHLMQTEKPHLIPETRPEDLIKALGTNRTYLANAIKQNKQQTISEYILTLRLNHAQALLADEQNNMLIEEISIASGFNSLRTFNRNFKNETNMTPEEYRSNLKRT